MKSFSKLPIEVGPLVLFFIINAKAGIFAATTGFMIATVIALVLSYILFKKIPVIPLVSGIFVMSFGGLTLWFDNEIFIKLKPTIVSGLFAAILLGGLGAGKSLLKPLFGAVMALNDQGWRKLTLRWGIFFIVMAVLNEIVWRNFPTDFWAGYKLFGALPLTILFTLSQAPLITRHQIETEPES